MGKVKLLYGTTNRAKLGHMRGMLAGLPVEVLGLADMQAPPPEVPEEGASPLDNARQKAGAYWAAYGMPVFAVDQGLYFEGVKPEEQPGVHVRRVGGKSLTDAEMVEWYAGLATQYGGKLAARYHNAVCAVWGPGEGQCLASMEPLLSGEAFDLVAEPCGEYEPGFPLDCLSVGRGSGRYYTQMEDSEFTTGFDKGFRAFFEVLLERMQVDAGCCAAGEECQRDDRRG